MVTLLISGFSFLIYYFLTRLKTFFTPFLKYPSYPELLHKNITAILSNNSHKQLFDN